MSKVERAMFLVRQAKVKDVPTLLKMARMVYFINLPPSEIILTEKIQHSARCFVRAAGGKPDASDHHRRRPLTAQTTSGMAAMEQDSEFFMFVIEEIESGGVVGTSQVRAHQGGPGNPNWSMKTEQRRFHSEQLGQGTTHTVAKLYGDETGPTELGGLILQPSHRGHRARPGRLLSFVRFHFIGLFRALFADRILAEMMGPVNENGDNDFWDYFGRKFIPVKFAEADRFCQHNRSFIAELLPKDDIYLTLFPLEVQNLVGVVSRDTIPARRLLESLGFRFRGFVDPFDGGPHLDANTDEVSLVSSTRVITLGKAIAESSTDERGIVSRFTIDGDFAAVETAVTLAGKELRITKEAMELLRVEKGTPVGFTPLSVLSTPPADANKSPIKKPRKKR